MGENTLSVKITADVVDLQTKFATAKAEVSALTKEMNDLAKQSAAGVLDPAGLAQLQDVSRQFLEAKQAARELSDELKGTHESSVNLGEGLGEIRGQISSAFELTGIAAAYEGIKQVGEVVEQLGARATQMHAMSEVLGVTTDEFQSMAVAAEEGGTSIEVFARAQERLISLLTQARDGSGAAVDKLLVLGLTTAQINDPTTKINEVLGVLRERLENSATAQDTMNELIKDFGPRAALAAEAIKEYDGSAEGVAATMAKLHGLNEGEIAQAHEMHVRWGELGQVVENLSTKALTWAASMGEWVRAHNATLAAVASAVGAPGPQQEKPNAGKIDRSATDAAKRDAQAQMDLQREIAQQELENVKAGIEAYKQGSAEKLAQVREYAQLAAQYYSSDEIDKVRAAKTAEIAETRAYNENQKTELQKLSDFAEALDTKAVSEHARVLGQLNALDLKQATEREKQLDDLVNYAQALDTRVTQQHAKAVADLTKINAKETQDQLASWQFLTNGMRQGFDTALRGMLTGTESFGQAMRGMFTSVFDAIINKLAEWAAEWVTEHLLALAVSKSTATDEVITNAGVAASAAMASVAAIPFVGWLMAPEVGATTYAEALAIGLPKAAGGWDIPQGLNPVTQLHSGEMVLPKPIADTVRNATQQGGAQGGSGGGSRTVHIHGKGGFTSDQLASMLKELGHRFVIS